MEYIQAVKIHYSRMFLQHTELECFSLQESPSPTPNFQVQRMFSEDLNVSFKTQKCYWNLTDESEVMTFGMFLGKIKTFQFKLEDFLIIQPQ